MDRSQETSERTAAPPAESPPEERRVAPLAPTVDAGRESGGYDGAAMPPHPLPPLAFRAPAEPVSQAPPPVPMPARVFHRSGPAFDLAAPPQSSVPPYPVDAVLSEIDAEAAERSLTAVSGAQPETEEKLPISPRPPPTQNVASPLDLGSVIPSAPRLEMPSRLPEAEFGSLQADLFARPALAGRTDRVSAAKAAPVRRPFWRWALRIAVWLVVGWLAVVLSLMVAYRFVDPPGSMLMLQQWLSGQKIESTWVPIEQISPNVIRAVIASEDSRFCDHHGVDFESLAGAVSDVGSGAARGASTISMQVVKNLFLWSSRSYVRKAVELPLTFMMETIWPKRRIMEVYLNIAEWGPGIFGIEAAAQARFHKPASRLSAGEASRLAVALPNPRVRNPAKPGPGMQRLARLIQMRMRIAATVQTSCVLPRRRN